MGGGDCGVSGRGRGGTGSYFEAIKLGKVIALSNKEVLVAAASW